MQKMSSNTSVRHGTCQPTKLSTLLAALAGGLLLSTFASTVSAQGQPPAAPAVGSTNQLIADGLDRDGHLHLTVGKTAVITTRGAYKQVSVGQPDIADVNAIGPGNILVTAKKMGNTQIIVWDDNNRSQVVDVAVDFDMQAMTSQLKAMFPDSKIEVSALNGAIALRGRVPNLQTADEAVAIASPFAQKVLNFLDVGGGKQIMLQVRFAEVSRGAITNLGVNTFFTDGRSSVGFFNGPGGNPIGALANNAAVTIDPSVTVAGAGHFASMSFEYFLSALKTNNLARVLAEPNVVVTSGQQADFLAGGEIPVPVPQSGSGGATTITIEYKQFGVRLNVVPVALGDGKIRMKVAPEVSQLDFSNAVTLAGTQIPALTKRSISTTIELGDGQTFAIAGLLNDTVQSSRSSTPYLGDIPVLGALFRSVRYERKETELLVLVSPRIVAPMNPDQVTALPGEHWRHPTDEQLFWMRDIGGEMTPEQVEAKKGGSSGSKTTTKRSTAAATHGEGEVQPQQATPAATAAPAATPAGTPAIEQSHFEPVNAPTAKDSNAEPSEARENETTATAAPVEAPQAPAPAQPAAAREESAQANTPANVQTAPAQVETPAQAASAEQPAETRTETRTPAAAPPATPGEAPTRYGGDYGFVPSTQSAPASPSASAGSDQ